MDRRGLAQELRRWVVEEMGVPPQKAPQEDVLQRLFFGQCTGIWKYIIHHVRSQRTVRNIEGNLLWYQQLQHSEAQRSAEEEEQQRRKQLCREILELRSELQHLQEQIQSAEEEIGSQELNGEKSQDYRRRALLLRAFKKKKEVECEAMRESNAKIQYRCEQLQDVSRESQREIIFPLLESGSASSALSEPEVMRDVRGACQVRLQFLRSLRDDSVSGSSLAGGEELRSLAHQQWMSMAEKVWSSHPPNHIVFSLEHLALEATRDMRLLQSSLAADPSQTSSNISETPCDVHDSRDALETSKQTRSYYEGDRHSSAGDLPSFNSLIQEGWAESVQVTTQLCAVQHQMQEVSECLAGKIQEVHKTLADDIELSQLSRAAFDAELRSVLLRGCQDALLQECRALQESAVERKQEVKHLQQQQQNIQDSCLLLDKKQKQIQILIRANATAKSQIRRSCTEVQKYVKEKLLPRPQEVALESQRLKDSIMKDNKHFSAISLPAFQKLCADGVNEVPAQDLSINRLSSPQCLYYNVYKGMYASMGLSLYKAPETILCHVADMKKQLLFLRSQLSSRNRAMNKVLKRLRESRSPDTDALLKLLSAHYAQQTDQLVPRLQHLIEQCEKSQEYGTEAQATVKDWWEQPAQTCLPWEQRGGLTLQQWRDRWMVAVTALQRASGGRR
ncbi:PREDICTED: HAUS augmin-like complex subunit 5 [Nanorana parkeri]|uniref:HAUS augmin-like complex subunit 5 n=1 Tax=Nanorana parkeri TaxID=125878 RepID=UPI00085424A5|nr:PREDICTED: HAUS augmin-like complex subunit 5 [Nanorana parkeri]